MLIEEVADQMTAVVRSTTSKVKRRILRDEEENESKRMRPTLEELGSQLGNNGDGDNEVDMREREENNTQKEDEDLDYDVDVDSAVEPFGDDASSHFANALEQNREFPQEDSDHQIWNLPSGLPAADAISGTQRLPKAHPSNFGIIRIGYKVKNPNGFPAGMAMFSGEHGGPSSFCHGYPATNVQRAIGCRK